MSEGLKFGIGILELSCDHLLNSFVSLGHLIFLMALVPFCGSSDGSHSKKKYIKKSRYKPLGVFIEVSEFIILSYSLSDVITSLENWMGLLVGVLHFFRNNLKYLNIITSKSYVNFVT